MAKKSPQSLRAEAATLDRFAAEAMCRAERLRREAEAMKDEPRELVAWWFAWARQVRRAH
jgi:hypothetical protein